MSRSGYVDDCDDVLQAGRWRGRVMSAMRGKRGQAFLKEALAVLEAMPEKRLIAGDLVFDGDQPFYAGSGEEVIVGGDVLVDRWGAEKTVGSVCLLGAVGQARGLDMSDLDPEDIEMVAPRFGLADAMTREIVYWNDEGGPVGETPEHRWKRMRDWVASKIIKEAA